MSIRGQVKSRTFLYLVVALGLTSGLLYALLLPLWEGFDEAFHYAYVQELTRSHDFPVLGRSLLSNEIWHSLQLVPVSHVVQKNIPALMTFESYDALPPDKRAELRSTLAALSPDEKRSSLANLPHPNYEAHQAPMAYLLLALPDALLSNCSMLTRVVTLRIVSIFLSVLLTATAAVLLCSQLNVPSPFQEVVLVLIFSSQMFYATAAHICNDWLAAPLVSWLIVLAIRLYSNPSTRNALAAAFIGSVCLLTKSYFLAFVPLMPGIITVLLLQGRLKWRAACTSLGMMALLCGPWYVRNLNLYGSLSGMPESKVTATLPQLMRAVAAVPWSASIGYMARASLWTGNNEFNTFSRLTLNIMLSAMMLAGCYYLAGLARRSPSAGERITLIAVLLYILALAYSTAVSSAYTHGKSAGASPWYMQVLLVPVLTVLMRGVSRGGTTAKVAVCLVASLWLYVLLATYFVKLLPYYSGYYSGFNRLSDLARWYLQSGGLRGEILSNTALAPAAFLYVLLGIVVTLTLLIAIITWKSLLAPTSSVEP